MRAGLFIEAAKGGGGRLSANHSLLILDAVSPCKPCSLCESSSNWLDELVDLC